ncbi:serine protease inhibitor Cvsi-2-like [Ruditapes philippinarum]|uniref:serine protease inhibitor Cvsi-2-like n=1 Tax=Ruditapes philippinarum TaxID=129788 RepID=UPI00295C0072|nr:serine protease inhibitor Cvsi-2-like [Ruditapes philippinarum]
MRVLVVAVLVALSVVYVSGEPCKTNQDCVNHGITTCSGGTHVVCHNQHCECLRTDVIGKACTQQSDCTCDRGHPHCIDNHCRCTKF